jgi:hypothetical protein
LDDESAAVEAGLPEFIEYGLPKEAKVTLCGAALLLVHVTRSPV